MALKAARRSICGSILGSLLGSLYEFKLDTIVPRVWFFVIILSLANLIWDLALERCTKRIEQ